MGTKERALKVNSGMMNAPRETLTDSLRTALEKGLLASWLPRQRWFRSKARAVASVAIEAAIPVTSDATFCAVRVDFMRGDAERYAVPLQLVSSGRRSEYPEGALAGEAPDGRLFVDACHDATFRAAWLDIAAGRFEASGTGGLLRGRPDGSGAFADTERAGKSRLYAGEQSNTSFNFDERVVVKLFRRFESGIHPEPEMLRFLRHAGYRDAPVFLASLEWAPDAAADAGGTESAREAVTLAVAQEFVRDAELAWEFWVRELEVALRADSVPPALLQSAAMLGASVGALHATLASRPDDPDFAPEPLMATDLDAARAGSLARLDTAAGVLEKTVAARLRERLRRVAAAGAKIRVHGDLHLGQILLAESGPRLLDFEGEPGRPLAEARRKASPLRDVAGMLRSFHYAAHVALRNAHAAIPEDRADAFARSLGEAFRHAWHKAIASARLFSEGAFEASETLDLLNFFILEKALYELEYERNNRPDWVEIPRRGLRILAG